MQQLSLTKIFKQNLLYQHKFLRTVPLLFYYVFYYGLFTGEGLTSVLQNFSCLKKTVSSVAAKSTLKN